MKYMFALIGRNVDSAQPFWAAIDARAKADDAWFAAGGTFLFVVEADDPKSAAEAARKEINDLAETAGAVWESLVIMRILGDLQFHPWLDAKGDPLYRWVKKWT